MILDRSLSGRSNWRELAVASMTIGIIETQVIRRERFAFSWTDGSPDGTLLLMGSSRCNVRFGELIDANPDHL